jgi:ATP-dependent DNA helicase RecG
MNLYKKLTDINMLGLGEKSFLKLKKLGLESPYDLFFNFPRKYEDYTTVTKIADIGEAQNSENLGSNQSSRIFTVRGTLLGIANKKTRRRGFTVTEAVVADETGPLKVVWFNQPYLVKMLSAGRELILSGSIKFDTFSRAYVMESPTRSTSAKIVPIYSETAGMTSFFIGKVYAKIKQYIKELVEWLPAQILESHHLISLRNAVVNIHEPKSLAELQKAQRRLAFDELFIISLKANMAKLEIEKKTAPRISPDIDSIKDFIKNLPFELTGDQKKALWQIIQDLDKPTPMNRLLNGDVGSGKTIIAAIASLAVKGSGLRTIVMAPTEILAVQHYEVFKKIFSDEEVGIITSSRKENKNAVILVGTHALLNLDKLDNLGLVIVDEQHRFGVKQRASLQELSTGDKQSTKMSPHFLSMTATPIPRTLHLALFGDLDVSLIKEKPTNRKEIKTRFVESWNREKAYNFIQKQIEAKRQVFVVCPLIEDKSSVLTDEPVANLFEVERKSVKAESEKLHEIYPNFKIGMLHGKMKAKEKQEIMDNFSKNEINILVSTSVIEVGVDIPNASVMIVEDAERFGLAQIHQFRGRVGRSSHQSFCFLFSNTQSEKALHRLKSLEAISDGFELAEIDLEMRGPGAIFGTEQSGMLDLKMASISDRMLVLEASKAAKEIAPKIADYPLILEKIQKYLINKHLE